ncbi:MAG: ABC transporter permease [Lachnospiraceae bacterium]|nr:ABC transporter permease [Lachnospiraceae bacterium]
MFKRIKEIYEYRTMIASLVKRDLKGRYKGSVLGFLWTFINPLFQLLIYTFVFSIIMRSGIKDYYMFLFVALIPWIFFSTSLAGGATSITGQKNMVQKIYFPREVLPISFVISQFVNMLLSFIVIFAVMLIMRYTFNPLALLCLIPVMITEFILALGFTFILSAVTVYFQDMQFIMGIITMAWQFLSPVMYSADRVPEKFRTLYMLNPMAPIIVAYRDILYYAKVPELSTLLMALAMGIILFLIGWFSFDRMQRHFAEEM